MEVTAHTGITEVATLLMLHRGGVDSSADTKLQAKFTELADDNLCTRIELFLELNLTTLEPAGQLLIRICSLQGIHQLATEYLDHSTPLQVDLLSCINGVIIECHTCAPDRAIITGGVPPVTLPASFTGIYISLSLPMHGWTCAKNVARHCHLLCATNPKVKFVISYHGNGRHSMVEYQCRDHIRVQGHTLMTTLYPHYYTEPRGLTSLKNKLRVVRGNKQRITGVRTRSGDTLTLLLSVACAAAPLLSLAKGKKLPADRLCKAAYVTAYGAGGVPLFPSSSQKGLILSQIADWEDYGVAIGNQSSIESSGENFDQTIIPSFHNELIVTKDSLRTLAVEQSCVLHVFLFIEATIESCHISPTDLTSSHLRSLQILQHDLEDIQLSHLKQFHTAFHSSLNKLLCNYNKFSKVSSVLEEAIPSVGEAVASIVGHSKNESFQQSCYNIMEMESTGDIQQWLTSRMWRIASHKLGAQYHDGRLTRAAEEPDTPDIVSVVASSHRPSHAVDHDDSNMFVPDDESVMLDDVTSRRCYHSSALSLHHELASQYGYNMDDSFTALGSEEDVTVVWSDTDHTISDDDITDDELWDEDNTMVDDISQWDNSNATADSTVVDIPSVMDASLYRSSSSTLQAEESAVRCSTNQIEEQNTLSNENTPAEKSPNRSTVTEVVPLTMSCSEPLQLTSHNESSLLQRTGSNSQAFMYSPTTTPMEDIDTCFEELGDVLSSPETMAITPLMGGGLPKCSNTDNVTLDQFSVAITEPDDDNIVEQDFDWDL